jgi:hypothetical protein
MRIDARRHRAWTRGAMLEMVDHPTAKLGAIQHKHSLPRF